MLQNAKHYICQGSNFHPLPALTILWPDVGHLAELADAELHLLRRLSLRSSVAKIEVLVCSTCSLNKDVIDM